MIENNIDALRVKIALALVFIVGAFLLGGLIWLQVIDGQMYARRAAYNSLRFLSIPSTRGNIIDRNEEVIVNSISGYTINVTYTSAEQNQAVISFLAPLLLNQRLREDFLLENEDMNLEDNADEFREYVKNNKEETLEVLKENIKDIIESQRYFRRYEPIKIAPIAGQTVREVDMSVVAAVEGSRAILPNVNISVQPIRQYKLGDYAFHILGSINQVDRVGNEGLERSFNETLSGVDGRRLVEVNVHGRPVDDIGTIEPIAGNDLVLTIDSNLQQVAEDALLRALENAQTSILASDRQTPENMLPDSGAVIVMDVRTGEILASASMPQIERDNYAFYSSAEAQVDTYNLRYTPLINKATHSLRPPGSLMKPLIGLAALEQGVASSSTHIYCRGSYRGLSGTWPLSATMYCWDRSGHGGPIDIVAGLKVSCNIYFYPLGEKLGIDNLKMYYDRFGFDRTVSLTTGSTTHRELFTLYQGRPMPADLAQLAIGQGALSVSPLQVVQFVSIIANAELNDDDKYVGKMYKPYVVSKVVSNDGEVIEEFKPEVIEEIIMEKEALDLIRKGLRDVIMQRGGIDGNTGTAYWQFHQGSQPIFPFEIAGKTGTSQETSWGNHGWFFAYAPYDEPEIAVIVLLEQGRTGGSTGGPVVREIFYEYFADRLE